MTRATTVLRTPLRRVAHWLESEPGRLATSLGRALPLDPVRTLELPDHVAVIGVGGATIGGSGRTPLAIAIVSALAARGVAVALVGHGYGARIDRPHQVRPSWSAVGAFGDEAVVAARALEGVAPVIVGPTREGAVRHAAERAAVVVVDRLLQTRPRRLACALLATTLARSELGGATFPFGDRAASSDRLLAASDEVVRIPGPDAQERVTLAPAVDPALRVALITSLARPARARDAAARVGVSPVVHVERPDHAPIDSAERERLASIARAHRVDALLVDAKTRAQLAGDETLAQLPLHVLHHAIVPSAALVDRVVRACEGRAATLAVRPGGC